MKFITVDAYEIALVGKNGKLIKVLQEGRHWIGFGKEVMITSTTEPLKVLTNDLLLVIKSPLLADSITVVDIAENEIGIQTKDGKFDKLLETGTYVFWNSPIEYKVEKFDLNETEVSERFPKHLINKPEFLAKLRVYPVESYQKGILYIDGKYVKTLEPGLYYFWKSSSIATVKTVDLRLQNMDISGQELLTKDKAGIRLNFVTQYKVIDAMKALVETKDFEKQLYSSIQLSLREYIGTMTLDQLLASKEAAGPYIKSAVTESADLLGIELISCGIKDIILPGDVKD